MSQRARPRLGKEPSEPVPGIVREQIAELVDAPQSRGRHAAAFTIEFLNSTGGTET